ncbi:hypothetical protein D3C81_1293710 [compost metagenome]
MAERAIDIAFQMRRDGITGTDSDEHHVQQQGEGRKHHAEWRGGEHQSLDHLSFDHFRAAGRDVVHIRNRALDVSVELNPRVAHSLRFVQRIDALIFYRYRMQGERNGFACSNRRARHQVVMQLAGDVAKQ